MTAAAGPGEQRRVCRCELDVDQKIPPPSFDELRTNGFLRSALERAAPSGARSHAGASTVALAPIPAG